MKKDVPRRLSGVPAAKGGVGKTTVAVNLFCALADHGLRLALVDAAYPSSSASQAIARRAETILAREMRP